MKIWVRIYFIFCFVGLLACFTMSCGSSGSGDLDRDFIENDSPTPQPEPEQQPDDPLPADDGASYQDPDTYDPGLGPDWLLGPRPLPSRQFGNVVTPATGGAACDPCSSGTLTIAGGRFAVIEGQRIIFYSFPLDSADADTTDLNREELIDGSPEGFLWTTITADLTLQNSRNEGQPFSLVSFSATDIFGDPVVLGGGAHRMVFVIDNEPEMNNPRSRSEIGDEDQIGTCVITINGETFFSFYYDDIRWVLYGSMNDSAPEPEPDPIQEPQPDPVQDYDAIAPTIPTGLTVTDNSVGSITLSWTPSEDNFAVARYSVYRDSTFIGVTELTSYTDSTVSPATFYSYRVRADDASGNRSAFSDPVEVISARSSDQDLDEDGYTHRQGDCNESDPNINPGAEEVCGNNVDENCDGKIC